MTASIGTTVKFIYYEQRVIKDNNGSIKNIFHVRHQGLGSIKTPISFDTYQRKSNKVHFIEMNGTIEAQETVFSAEITHTRPDGSVNEISSVAIKQPTLNFSTYVCVIL